MPAVLTGLVLRAGALEDLEEIMITMADAFDPAFGEGWTGAQCAGVFGLPGVWVTLAALDGEVAGFALSRIILDEAELLLLGVRPSWRRCGIGGALLDRTLSIARDQGGRRLHLEVRAGNAAIELYSHAGFTQLGRRPNYYRGRGGQLFDALTLAIDLAN